MTIADLATGVLGPDLPIGLRAYDGSRAGPADPPATIVVKSPDAVRRLVTAPGELGFGRAYVAGDLDIEGDMFAVLALRHRFANGLHLIAPAVARRAASSSAPRACGRCRRRPRRRGCTAGGTARRATPPRSRTTTTSRTTSTGSCSGRR